MPDVSLEIFDTVLLLESSISILSTRETKELAGVNTSNEALLTLSIAVESLGRGSVPGLRSSKWASTPESVEKNL